MLQIKREKSFIKDFDKTKLNEIEFARFVRYVALLSEQKPLPKEAREHQLNGKYKDTREFHISGDMLVIYMVESDTIKLLRLGTHSQLFG